MKNQYLIFKVLLYQTYIWLYDNFSMEGYISLNLVTTRLLKENISRVVIRGLQLYGILQMVPT